MAGEHIFGVNVYEKKKKNTHRDKNCRSLNDLQGFVLDIRSREDAGSLMFSTSDPRLREKYEPSPNNKNNNIK